MVHGLLMFVQPVAKNGGADKNTTNGVDVAGTSYHYAPPVDNALFSHTCESVAI